MSSNYLTYRRLNHKSKEKKYAGKDFLNVNVWEN